MKKLLLLVLFTNLMNSQTLLQENFDALGSPIALPTGWTMLNLSSPIGTSTWFRGTSTTFPSYSGPADGYIAVNYNSGAGTSYLSNWLMTPPVNVQNGDEISFYTRIPAAAYPDRLELRMSTLGASSTAPTGTTGLGSYTTLCTTVNPSLNNTDYPITWTKITYVVAGLTGEVSCRFALRYHVSSGGPSGANSNYVGVDSFQIKRPVMNDLSLDAITLPAVILAGNYTFNGTVTNRGTNAVASYQVTWQSNGGTINTHNVNVTGVNIAPGGTNNFSHSIPLNAVNGNAYSLNFSVSTVNGSTDGNVSDNNLSKSTQVASGSTAFKPLLEKFTSSTCAPCASYNNATFNPFYTAQNQNFNYIAYQMNWPGAGDPYYFAEAGVRRNYYGVNAITSLWIDGSEYSTGNNQTALTTHVNNEGTKTAYFALSGDRNLSGNNAVVNYNITPYLSGNYTLHAAVIEKLTTLNVSTNGETSFKHVMMKMVPDASGTSLNLVAGTPVNGQINASLAGTNIEESTDLEVILFLQNNTTKEVVQSFKATDALSLDDTTISKIKLYPNPATNIIRFSNEDMATILITDVTGKVVLQSNNVDKNSIINISNLNSGIYFVNIKNETINETIKFVKN
jgi:hypothetical protein